MKPWFAVRIFCTFLPILFRSANHAQPGAAQAVEMNSGYSKQSTFRRILAALPAPEAAWLDSYERVILDTIPAFRPPTPHDLIRAHDAEHNPADWSLRRRAKAIEADLARASVMNRASTQRLVSAAIILQAGGKPLKWRQILSIIRPL